MNVMNMEYGRPYDTGFNDLVQSLDVICDQTQFFLLKKSAFNLEFPKIAVTLGGDLKLV